MTLFKNNIYIYIEEKKTENHKRSRKKDRIRYVYFWVKAGHPNRWTLVLASLSVRILDDRSNSKRGDGSILDDKDLLYVMCSNDIGPGEKCAPSHFQMHGTLEVMIRHYHDFWQLVSEYKKEVFIPSKFGSNSLSSHLIYVVKNVLVERSGPTTCPIAFTMFWILNGKGYYFHCLL